MVKEFVKEEIHNVSTSQDEIVDKVKSKVGELPTKKYEPRNSMLTDLYHIKHVRTIYHITLAIFIGNFIHSVAYYYVYEGKIDFGFSLLKKGFVNFHLLVLVWLGMFFATLPVYFGFQCWATIRTRLKPKSWTLKVWDNLCLGVHVLYYPGFMYYSTYMITHNGQQIAASFGLLVEMTRLLMKSHAFVRSNAPRVLAYKPHSDHQKLHPDFNQFIYFWFAPTLIYQDNYPRTNSIRWTTVIKHFIEFFFTILFLSFIIDRFIIRSFSDFGTKYIPWSHLVVTILGNFIPGMLVLLSVFYMILHTWSNAFAEMLRFADRLFYKDWWTSSDQSRYYRTWNVVVHDWLYTYVYKDFYEIVTPKNKTVAKLMVFFLSAIFHDYVLGFAFNFSLPILFVCFFGFGVALTFFKIKPDMAGNIFFWYGTALGCSINSAMYAIEYYSRVRCPIENVTIASYFLPNFIYCNNRFT